jgi:hypothetical protein
LPARQLIFLILRMAKWVRILLLQLLEHQVNRILKFLIILPDFRSVDKLNERGKVLFLLWAS